MKTRKARNTTATGYRIPAPPEDPRYHETAAGYVGDYRPLAERQADPDAPGPDAPDRG